MAAVISQRDFHVAATKTGDLGVIEAYFAQTHVAADVARVNAFFQHRAPSINIYDANPADAWYFAPPPANDPWRIFGDFNSFGLQEFVFTKTLMNGLTEVVEWFYDSARAVSLGPTLAALLPFTGALAADENQIRVIETLVTSEVYATRFNGTQQFLLLSDWLNLAIERNRVDLMDLLVAHGANVNATSVNNERDCPLASCAAMGNKDSVAALIEHGAIAVGADLLIHASHLGNVESVSELLRSGADWGNHTGHANPLHAAAEEGFADLVRIYLEEGYADIDARDDRGATAIMMATWQPTARRGVVGPHAAEAVAHVLIDCGADLSLKDAEGRTALHHAVGTEYTSVVALLLGAGLDSNERDIRRDRALDLLQLARLDDEEEGDTVRQAELLVGYGTDLGARGSDGACALDRLQETITGRALLARLASVGCPKPTRVASSEVANESHAQG